MERYKIVRFYGPTDNRENETIKTGLTLEEAQEHCNDDETSSTTCSEETADEVGAKQWFDGYTEE